MLNSVSKLKKELSAETTKKLTSPLSAKKSDINSNSQTCETNNDSENVDDEFEFEDDDDLITDSNSTQDTDNSDTQTKAGKGELKFQVQFNNASGVNRCNYCKEQFENPLMLLRHKREFHKFPKTLLPPDEIEKYYDYPNRNFCPICKKAIKTNNYRSLFLKHLQTHTYNVFECVICKRKFKRRDHMLNHQKRHVVPIEDFIGNKKSQS